MFLRFYVLARVFRDHCDIWMHRTMIYKSGYRDRGGPEIDTMFCIKASVNNNKVTWFAFTCILVILIFSWSNYLIQREASLLSDNATLFHSIWATTFLLFRGTPKFPLYDDIGRILELVTVIIGILVLAVGIALVTSSMDITVNERFAALWLEKHAKNERRRIFAAELLQAAWRLHQLQVKCPEDATPEVEIYLENLIYKHKRYREECVISDGLTLDPTHDKLFLVPSLNRFIMRSQK